MPTRELEILLNCRARQDEWYQRLLSECTAAEPEYQRIRNSLTEADQELLERYISLCEELEYRRTCLALELNK